jgi:hypothetical protein
LVEWILDQGYENIHVPSPKDGNTLVTFAIENEDLKLLKKILENKFFDEKKESFTLLEIAWKYQRKKEVFQFLIDNNFYKSPILPVVVIWTVEVIN